MTLTEAVGRVDLGILVRISRVIFGHKQSRAASIIGISQTDLSYCASGRFQMPDETAELIEAYVAKADDHFDAGCPVV